MIIIMANEQVILNYQEWIKTLPDKEFKIIFPRVGKYEIYLLNRDYGFNPIIANVADCVTRLLREGTLVKYVVE